MSRPPSSTPPSSTPRGLAALKARIERRWPMFIKEMSAFGVVGGVNFMVDLAAYQVMYSVFAQGALVSKVVSTALTSTLAYFMHRHWSFAHRAKTGVRREYTLFILLSAVSLGIGLAIIGATRYGLGQTDIVVLQIANIISIGVGVVFRFYAYKRWVFLPAEQAAAGEASRD